MPVMVRVCRRTSIMGLITLLLRAMRNSAASHWVCFYSGCALSVVRALCQDCAHGWALGELIRAADFWESGGAGDLSAGSAAEGQPSTRQDRCGERSSCPTFRGAHGLCVEQDFSPYTLQSVNGTNSLQSLLLARFPLSLYLLIRLFHQKRAVTEILWTHKVC